MGRARGGENWVNFPLRLTLRGEGPRFLAEYLKKSTYPQAYSAPT
jgi:hypothetical protein